MSGQVRSSSDSSPFNNDYTSQLSTPDDNNLQYALNSRIMVAAIIVLFLVIVFIMMLHLYAKWFWNRSSRSIFITRAGGGGIMTSAAVGPSLNTGLDAAFIAQLPTFTFKAHGPAADTDAEKGLQPLDSMEAPLLECAVCLSEFQENEQGRILPACKHTFHTQCIDMWFLSHSTCPLCRTIVSASASAAVPSPANVEQQAREGQEAMGASPNAQLTPSNPAQLPCNVLFWGNGAQVASTQEPSSSSNALPVPASRATRPLPQITIVIPPIDGGILTISTPGRRSSRSTCCHSLDQAAGSSASQPPLKSPGLRASLKKMLSRQSSRHTDQGNEASPK